MQVLIQLIRRCSMPLSYFVTANIPYGRYNDIMMSRDFDGFDLRMRLPAVVSKLHKAINTNGGVTYIHCTAGLGRAPAVAVSLLI